MSRSLSLLGVRVAACLVLPGVLAADLPNKAGWNVTADPGEKIVGPFNLKGGISCQGNVVFPSTPSAFVAVNPPRTRDVWQVYDLRTMKPVGKPLTINGRFNVFTRPALSPDGKHMAVRLKSAGADTVEVWSVQTGQSVRKIEVDPDPRLKARYVDLLGKGRLWTAKHLGESPLYTARTTFQVWDVGTGKETSRYGNPLVPLGKWHTFSAGRRYQWMEQTGGWFLFLVWDVNTGKMVGEREFQTKKEPWGQAAGLAFSPDGEEMAMLWRLGKKPDLWGRLLCFEVKTGKKLFDHPIGYDLRQIDSLWFDGGPRCLQWWPPRKGWLLFGHLLVDQQSGAVVYKVGKAPGFSGAIEERRFLDADHLTTLEGTFDKKLEVIALPRKEIAAAVAKARGQ
jgi:hypothetical protein